MNIIPLRILSVKGCVSHMYQLVHVYIHLLLSYPQDEPMAINDIRDDLRQECEKFGVVKKILIFDVSGWSSD